MSFRIAAALSCTLMMSAIAAPMPARAAGGDLCSGPGALLCGLAVGAAGLIPKPAHQRMMDAIDAGNLDELKKLKGTYPAEFKSGVHELFDRAASDYILTNAELRPAPRWYALMNFLCDEIGDLNSPRFVKSMGQITELYQPRAQEVLALLFERGAIAREIDLPYYTSCARGVDPCPILGFLLDHGMDANRRRTGGSLLWQALDKARLGDAQLLVAHGADVNLRMDGLYTGWEGVGNFFHETYEKNGDKRDAYTRRADARKSIAFLIAHGASVESRATYGSSCNTLYQIADLAHDQETRDLLQSLGAKPSWSVGCHEIELPGPRQW